MADRDRRRRGEQPIELALAVRRAVLRERGARLARRTSTDVRREALERVLLCVVEKNLYGLKLAEVSKVRPLLGWAPSVADHPALLGLVAEEGQLQPLYDLPTLLGTGSAPEPRGWLVVLRQPFRASLRVPELPITADVAPLSTEEPERVQVQSGGYEGKVLIPVSATALLARIRQHQGATPA